MALVKCRECGHEISDKASMCPNCGCPTKEVKSTKRAIKNKYLLSGLVVLSCVGLFLVLWLIKAQHALNNSESTHTELEDSLSETNSETEVESQVEVAPKEYDKYILVEITDELSKAISLYDEIFGFHEGVCLVKKKGKWGYIDYNGNEIVPCKYEDGSDFSEGLAAVKNQEGKWGCVNISGEEIVPCQYDKIGSAPHTLEWHDDRAVVRKNDRWGYINSRGEEIIPCQFDYASNFSESSAYVKLNGKNIMIGLDGSSIENENYYLTQPFHENLAPAISRYNGKRIIVNTNGEIVSYADQYMIVESFKGGFARVCSKSDKWGFINSRGKEVVPCKYGDVSDYSEGLARVVYYVDPPYDGRYGYVNTMGNEVVPCKYMSASNFIEGLAAVEGANGKYGFINKNGEEVIECKYNGVSDFSEGLAAVRNQNEKYGFINKNGEEVIECKYDYAGCFSMNGVAIVRKNDVYGFIDKKGKDTFITK